jgi:hypothetical protein
MKSGLTRSARLVATGALVLVLAGCGSDSPRPPVVIVTPEPVHAIISQTSFTNFEPDIWVAIELLLTQKGVLDITVDWTYPSTWMYVYLGNTKCEYAQLVAHSCPFILSSETQNPKPRVLLTEELEPGTYYLVLYNVPLDAKAGVGSKNTEAVSIQLGLTVKPSGQRSTTAVRLSRPQIVNPRF